LYRAAHYSVLKHDKDDMNTPATDIWLRGLIQAVFLLTVWWSAVARDGQPRDAA
jgi:hypothetical protein